MWRFNVQSHGNKHELVGMWENEGYSLRDQIKQDIENSKVITDEETGLKITKKKDLFALEEAIMNCWGILEELKLTQEYIVDDTDTKRMLESIVTIYSLKFDKLWKTFEDNE